MHIGHDLLIIYANCFHSYLILLPFNDVILDSGVVTLHFIVLFCLPSLFLALKPRNVLCVISKYIDFWNSACT